MNIFTFNTSEKHTITEPQECYLVNISRQNIVSTLQHLNIKHHILTQPAFLLDNSKLKLVMFYLLIHLIFFSINQAVYLMLRKMWKMPIHKFPEVSLSCLFCRANSPNRKYIEFKLILKQRKETHHHIFKIETRCLGHFYLIVDLND